MKAANLSWIVAVVAMFLLPSCAVENEDSPMGDAQVQARINANYTVLGVDGVYSALLDDCVPPAGNCFNNARVAPSRVYYQELNTAINTHHVRDFLQTDNGKLFLTSLDPKVAADLLAERTTIQKFSNDYFIVYPSAKGPYDGPNYSQGGIPLKPADIPD
ncbi:MAG: hypothetical protein AAGN35_02375 [Bacteroidota bacterium]